MKKIESLTTIIFLITTSFIFGQPANNDCIDAITISINTSGQCSYINGTTIDATDSGLPVDPPFDVLYNSGDVWYSFTTTATGTISFDGPTNTNNVSPLFEILEGDCGNLEIMSSFSTDPIFLEPNTDYFLRIWTNDIPDNFSFCLNEITPSLNVSCSTAIDIPQTNTNTCAQVVDVIISQADYLTSICHASSYYNQAWYSFTALTPAVQIDQNTNVQYEVYRGSCGNLISKSCTSTAGFISGLIPGEEYYIKWYTVTSTNTFNLDFCLLPYDSPLDEDFCSTAPTITPTPNGSCLPQDRVIINSALLPTSAIPGPSCSSESVKDAWYSFVAPSTGSLYFDWVSSSAAFEFYSLYENDCSSFQEVECSTDGNKQITGLTPSTTYLLRIGIADNQESELEFCLTEGLAGPNNDDCNGAISIATINQGVCTDVTPDFQWSSKSESEGCNEDINNSVWYTFTTPATGSVTIKGNESTKKEIVIYENNCNSLNEISCSSITIDSLLLVDLSPSTTYLMKIGVESNSSIITLCLSSVTSSAPGNDDCTGAFNRGTNAINFDTDGATYSSDPAPSCYEITSPDVWYKISGSFTGRLIHEVSGDAPRMSYALYSGTCADLELVQCHNDIGDDERHVKVGGVGTQYYMRLWHTNQQGFGLGTLSRSNGPINQSFPTNDNCNTATAVPLNTNIEADVRWADSDYDFMPSCSGFNGGDVWYSFTTGTTGNMILQKNGTSSSTPSFTVYSGTCGSLTEVLCATAGFQSEIYMDLDPNANYSLQVFQPDRVDNDIVTFQLSEGPATPTNDECTAAELITLNGFECVNTTVDNTLATASGQASPSCVSAVDKDVWYEINLQQDGIFVEIDASNNLQIYGALYSGACVNPMLVECKLINSLANFTNLDPSQNYYLRLFTDDGQPFDEIDICFREGANMSPNDECINAIDIPVYSFGNCQFVSGNNLGASGFSCFGPDIWYSFDAPSTGAAVFDLTGVSSSFVMQVHKGSCGNLEQLYSCTASGVPMSGLTPGETYFIQLSNVEENEEFFTYCISETLNQIPNEHCFNPTPIVSGVDECGPIYTQEMFGTNGYNSCFDQGYGNVFYTFNSGGSGDVELTITFSDFGPFPSQVAGYRIGESGCDLSQSCEILTNGVTETILLELTPNIDYTLELNAEASAFGSFEFCINQKPVPAENDQCSEAIPLTISADDSCSGLLNSSTLGANDDIQDCFPGGQEIFYSITPNEDNNYTITTSNQTYPLQLSMYDGCGGNQIGCSTDAMTIPLESGQTYLLALSSSNLSVPSFFDLCVYPAPIGSSDNNVGIGVSKPIQKLQVKNAIMLGNTDVDALGSIRFNGSDFEGFGQAGWTSLTGGAIITDNLGNHSATTNLQMSGNRIVGLGTPSLNQDAATKAYVDSHTDGDASPTNEHISSMSYANELLTINEGSNTQTVTIPGSTDNLGDHTATTALDMSSLPIENLASPTNNSDGATKAYVDSHTDGDANATNEHISSMTYNNDVLTINEGANTQMVTIAPETDNLGDHTATTTLDLSNNAITNVAGPFGGTDAATKAYVDSHTDGDASPTNERISSMSYTNEILTINEGTNTRNVNIPSGADDLGNHSATTSLNMAGNLITDVANPVALSDAATKGWVEGLQRIWNINTDDDLFYNDGHVGISNSDPEYPLDVNGGARMIRNSTSSSNPQLRVTSTTESNPARFRFETEDTPENFWSLEATSTGFQGSKFELIHGGQATNTVFTINDNDRIGFNTSTLEDRFSIASNVGENAFRVRVGSSTKLRVLSNGGISLGSNNTGVTPNDVYINDRLGIGINNPSVELDIDGRAIIKGNSSGENPQLTLEETNSGFSRMYMTNTSGKRWVFAADPDIIPANSVLNFFLDDVGNILSLRGSRRVGINNSGPSFPLHVGTNTTNGNGAHVTQGGTWTNGSSKFFKENISSVNTALILSKIAQLDVSTWQYIDSDEGTHIGPLAEDFHDVFGYGNNAQYISTVDTDGVALAGIKALIEENKSLKAKNQELEYRLAKIEALLSKNSIE